MKGQHDQGNSYKDGNLIGTVLWLQSIIMMVENIMQVVLMLEEPRVLHFDPKAVKRRLSSTSIQEEVLEHIDQT